MVEMGFKSHEMRVCQLRYSVQVPKLQRTDPRALNGTCICLYHEPPRQQHSIKSIRFKYTVHVPDSTFLSVNNSNISLFKKRYQLTSSLDNKKARCVLCIWHQLVFVLEANESFQHF